MVCDIERLISVHIHLQLRPELRGKSVRFSSGVWVKRTVVECFQFVASSFRILHALEQGLNSSIFLSPEIVRDLVRQLRDMICQEPSLTHTTRKQWGLPLQFPALLGLQRFGGQFAVYLLLNLVQF